MKRITVYTSDRLVLRRIQLLFLGRYEVFAAEDGVSGRASGDVVIVDLDSHSHVNNADLLISRRASEGILSIPLSLEEIENAVDLVQKRDTGSLILLKGERAVRLFGEVIKLTEVEFRVLEILARAPIGEYVSRERLMKEVWGDECDGGVVNVYIHYLRAKLEKKGEKIIISSRREGYKLDERIGR